MIARRLHLRDRPSLLRRDRTREPLIHQGEVADHRRERRAQLVRDVGEKLVLHPARVEQRHELPLQLRIRVEQRRVRAPQVLDQPRLLRGRGHLVSDHAKQRPRLRGDRTRLLEIEGHGTEHPIARLQRQRDDGAESELLRHFRPILERRVGHHVRHLDHPALRRRLAAGAEAEPHAHVAQERRVALRPVVYRRQPHQLTRAVDDVDAREGRAHERTHPVEGELEHLLRPVGREEGMDDLPDRDQLAHAGLRILGQRARPLARERNGSIHAANMERWRGTGQMFAGATSRAPSRQRSGCAPRAGE